MHGPARKITRSIIDNQSRVQNVVRRHRVGNIHHFRVRINPQDHALHRPHKVVIRPVIGSQSNNLTRQVPLPSISKQAPMHSILYSTVSNTNQAVNNSAKRMFTQSTSPRIRICRRRGGPSGPARTSAPPLTLAVASDRIRPQI